MEKGSAQCSPMTASEECYGACFWPGSVLDTATISNYDATVTLNGLELCGNGSITNDLWFLVTPTAPEMTISVVPVPGSCESGDGLQIALYDQCDAPPLACDDGGAGQHLETQTISAIGLVPGKPYFLLVDGYANEHCLFNIETNVPFGDTLAEPQDSVFFISGHVLIDQNSDCVADFFDEPGLDKWTVQLVQPDGTKRFQTTWWQGLYYFIVDQPGTYEVSTQPPPAAANLFEVCQNNQVVSVSMQSGIATADFPMRPTFSVNCHTLVGTAGLSLARPCQKVVAYFTVENHGPEPATAVRVAAILPQPFQFDSASVAVAATSGDTLFFDFANIAARQKKQFQVLGHLPCDVSIVGQTVCAEIWAPGMVCDTVGSAGSWPLLQAGAVCNGDTTASLWITNIGSVPTWGPVIYIIVEDEVVMRDEILASLAAGQSHRIDWPSDGSLLRIEARQQPSPLAFSAFESAQIIGCNGPGDPLIFGQWPTGSNLPWHDRACRTITMSFDPNQKTASPSGYRAEHFTRPNGDVEYTIDFQNTGTDTAFFVQILDTLSHWLDRRTVREVISSHPMRWDIYGEGIFRATFDPIILPDSTTNYAGSQGFVKFKISQEPELRDGTMILNSAAITFDINDPVITNETFNQICRNCLVVAVDEPKKGEKSFEVAVQPNPFSTQTTLEIADAPAGEKLFRLFDLTGRTVFSSLFEGRKLEISGEGLAGGAYFFTIEKDGKRLASGKIFSQR